MIKAFKVVITTVIFAILVCAISIVATSADTLEKATEAEPNNSRETATVMSVNNPISGNLADGDDVDWYSFTIENDGYIVIDFSHEIVATTDSVWKFFIYHNDGTYIDGSDTSWTVLGNKNNTVNAIGVPAGTYYVQVFCGKQHNAANYDLTVKYTQADDWETELNNVFSSADSILLGRKHFGNLSSSEDVDWYKLEVPSNGYAVINFNHETVSSTDEFWRMDIYREDVVTKYNGCDFYYSIPGNANKSTAQFGMSAGTYYIKVCAKSHSSVTYDITVNFTSSNAWETEINNTADTANIVNINSDFYGAITAREDVDWYKFELKQSGYMTIDFKHDILDSKNEFWRFEIYQSDAVTYYDGNRVYVGVVGNENKTTPQMGMKPGTYYIKVYRNDYSNTTYNMKINFKVASNWEKEINNSSETADLLWVNNTIYGSIYSENDVDWYKFEVEEEGYLTIDFKHTSINSTNEFWKMWVFHSDAVTYYGGSDSYYGISGNQDRSSCQMGVSPGVYYIKIGRSSLSTATYNITLNFTKSDKWETEINNSYDKAKLIEVNERYNGAMCGWSDRDWYKFELSSQSKIAVTFSHPSLESTDNVWKLFIYSADAVTERQATDIPGNTLATTTEYLDLAQGTYYLLVSPVSFNNATYAIQISEEHEHTGEWVQLQAPTCTGEGLREKTCTHCGFKETEPIKPLGHSLNEGEKTKSEGLFNDGEMVCECTVCGEEVVEVIEGYQWVLPTVIGAVIVISIVVSIVVKKRR